MRFYLIVLLSLLMLSNCNQTPPDRSTELKIFAAASLTESFTEIATTFETQNPDVDILLNFAGSQTLRVQLEQGAQADVFASANLAHADALHTDNLINEPVIFTYNQLTVIVPANNPAAIKTLADLSQPNLKLILAGAAVPAGRYAREVLENLNTDTSLGPNFSQRVLQNLVSEEDTVKGVVAKVQLGEADAGIVYTSDITPAVAKDVITLSIPAEYNVTANYPIAVVTQTHQPNLAQTFIAFVLSPQGQRILADNGFQSLP